MLVRTYKVIYKLFICISYIHKLKNKPNSNGPLFGLICLSLSASINNLCHSLREYMEVAYDMSISCFQLVFIDSPG
jgi:hypothetical protein